MTVAVRARALVCFAANMICTLGLGVFSIQQLAGLHRSCNRRAGAAINEIARNVQQAAGGTQEVSRNIAQVTQTAGETGGAARQVMSAAGELARQAESRRHDVEQFLSAIKAA